MLESLRITDKGGFMMNNRVNGTFFITLIDIPLVGMLAVTRSLGDATMKEFVLGNPYTTETAITKDDEFLILACDGVLFFLQTFSTDAY